MPAAAPRPAPAADQLPQHPAAAHSPLLLLVRGPAGKVLHLQQLLLVGSNTLLVCCVNAAAACLIPRGLHDVYVSV